MKLSLLDEEIQARKALLSSLSAQIVHETLVLKDLERHREIILSARGVYGAVIDHPAEVVCRSCGEEISERNDAGLCSCCLMSRQWVGRHQH